MQVINISPEGMVTTAEPRGDDGVDMKPFGCAEVCRASEILYDDNLKAWTVLWLIGPFKGDYLREGLMDGGTFNTGRVCRFDTYGRAVLLEGIALNHLLMAQQV